MSRAAAIPAVINALPEGKDWIAIKERPPGLSLDGVSPLVRYQRAEARRLEREVVAVGVTLNQ